MRVWPISFVHMEAAPVSLIGWLHTAACVIAMIAGTVQLVSRVGTPRHRMLGDAYFYSMVVANVTVLFIYEMDIMPRPGVGPLIGPVFGVFHWLAVITLALVIAARLSASHQHRSFFAYFHPICMIVTYWFLIGGAINEAFFRVDWVIDAARAMSPGAQRIGQYKLLFIAQFILDGIILAAVVMAVIQVRRRRRRVAAGPAQTAPTSLA